MAFTAKQQKFIELFDGNGTKAAKEAGYSGNDVALANTARNLLRNTEIAAAIRERQNKKINPLIATREERQAFWTSIMKDPAFEPRDRLKASELLAKSEGDFIERIEHSGKIGLESLVLGSLDDASPKETTRLEK